MKLVFATHNPNKSKEVQVLMPPGMEIVTLDEIGYTKEIPETGLTLEENALIKARTIYEATGINCFADDTGLEVNTLDGEPGVYSARYAGEPANSIKNMDKLLENLKSSADRSARFRTVFALIIDGKEHLFEGIVKGTIISEKHGEGGFGYDPIFLPDGFEQTFAQMQLSEKNKISHRGRALRKMVEWLKNEIA